jgi:hypothetical protein
MLPLPTGTSNRWIAEARPPGFTCQRFLTRILLSGSCRPLLPPGVTSLHTLPIYKKLIPDHFCTLRRHGRPHAKSGRSSDSNRLKQRKPRARLLLGRFGAGRHAGLAAASLWHQRTFPNTYPPQVCYGSPHHKGASTLGMVLLETAHLITSPARPVASSRLPTGKPLRGWASAPPVSKSLHTPMRLAPDFSVRGRLVG